MMDTSPAVISPAAGDLLPPGGTPAPRGTGRATPPMNAAAETLLCSYRREIYACLRRKGFRPEEADDLTQETLIRAYVHLSGFRGASMTAWLYRIAGNVAVDYLRKRRVATVPLENVALPDSGEEELFCALDRDERRTQVLSVIRDLPECHQRVLRLRFFEDRSMAELAVLLGCSPVAAKLRVFRAVTALRKRWHAL